ncbi:MAG: hypothetical protein ABI743_05150, partial [bacterium]
WVEFAQAGKPVVSDGFITMLVLSGQTIWCLQSTTSNPASASDWLSYPLFTQNLEGYAASIAAVLGTIGGHPAVLAGTGTGLRYLRAQILPPLGPADWNESLVNASTELTRTTELLEVDGKPTFLYSEFLSLGEVIYVHGLSNTTELGGDWLSYPVLGIYAYRPNLTVHDTQMLVQYVDYDYPMKTAVVAVTNLVPNPQSVADWRADRHLVTPTPSGLSTTWSGRDATGWWVVWSAETVRDLDLSDLQYLWAHSSTFTPQSETDWTISNLAVPVGSTVLTDLRMLNGRMITLSRAADSTAPLVLGATATFPPLSGTDWRTTPLVQETGVRAPKSVCALPNGQLVVAGLNPVDNGVSFFTAEEPWP